MLEKRSLSKRNRRADRCRRTSRFEPLEERCLLAMTANYLMVAAPDSVAAEAPVSNPNYGTYTITRSNETDTTHALFVRFHMTGTALGNSDYRLYHSDGTQVSLTSSFDPASQTNVYTGGVRIPANALSLTVELRPVDDHLAERDETAVFTIVPNDKVQR